MALELGMSVSGVHAQFKAVTAMPPLLYQKQLRLHEARWIMLSENVDVGEARHGVGYDDHAYYGREYKRHFGQPTSRGVERLCELAAIRID